MTPYLTPAVALPDDADRATLIGRAWLPGPQAHPTYVSNRLSVVDDECGG